ncbi:DUF3883 domain-containing protein [Eubacteriales bacterium mix99]
MKKYISDSLISEALLVMRAMKQYGCYTIAQINNMKMYYGINKDAALSLAEQCNWIVLKNETTYEITNYGENLLQNFNGMELRLSLYRDILKKYIVTCKPIWARKIPYGRNEAYQIMSDEEQVCFKKAGLMGTPVTLEEVEWWDSLAERERQEIERKQDDVGRKGEKLTIRYEHLRTQAKPIWESIESNLAGFDIISQVSDTNTKQILIEVKSSTHGLQDAFLYVSHNEWNFASAAYNQERYYFYLWLLETTPQLAVISYPDMLKHIPFNNGLGEWNEVSIPFAAFKDDFSPRDI